MKYCLAIDIGASSGRHIIGCLQDGKIVTEEIYRFDNGYVKKNGRYYWDIDSLFSSVCEGIKKCFETGIIPDSIAIDTWGVDYALLDENDQLIDGIIAYRDPRTDGIPNEVYNIINKRTLFDLTGIAENNFNTIFQLYEDKKSGRLKKAKSMLFVPCYLNYLLTGNKNNEYTFASTTGLLNVKSRTWDKEICSTLGFPEEIFTELSQPGQVAGMLKKDIFGFTCPVVLAASHDTASAVVSLPVKEKSPLFISSGTWSLIGVESELPYTDEFSESQKFTNEGGVFGTIRFLQNIMGLWMIQSIKHELKNEYSYQQLMELARKSSYSGVPNVNDNIFLAPDSMIDALKTHLTQKGYEAPREIGDIVRSVYVGLAHAYAKAADGIEKITHNRYDTIYIVGGGSKDSYLNELTAEISGRKVVTGITEATAIGNLLIQFIAISEIADFVSARDIVANSFKLNIWS